MGNQSQQNKIFHQRVLQYYSTTSHKTFHNVEIFKSKDLPMTFIMKIYRKMYDSIKIEYYRKIMNQCPPFLVNLYGVKIQRTVTFGPCNSDNNEFDQTVQFWQYLNYSLYDHILDRMRRKSAFTEHQIWHVLQIILQSLLCLKRNNLIWEVNPHQLMITPQSKVKCQWLNSMLSNNQVRNKQGQTQGQQLQNIFKYHKSEIFHETRLQKINKTERKKSSEIDISRPLLSLNQVQRQAINVKRIGILLIFMLSLQKFYNSQLKSLVNSIEIQSQQKIFLKPLLKLLKFSIQYNPAQTYSLEELYTQMQHNFRDQYELLINQNRKQDLQHFNIQAQTKHTKQIQSSFPIMQFKDHFTENKAIKNSNKAQKYVKKKQLSELYNLLVFQKPKNSKAVIQRRVSELRQYRKSKLKEQLN